MPDEALEIVQQLGVNLKYNLENVRTAEEKISSYQNYENLSGLVKKSQINESYANCSQSETNNLLQMRTLNEFIVNEMLKNVDLLLNDETFMKSTNIMDLVTTRSTRTSCFTKK